MTDRLILTRTVTRQECPWLSADLSEGSVVYEFRGATYGCISRHGVAVSAEPGKNPFFEVPWDAIAGGEWIAPEDPTVEEDWFA